MSVLISTPLRLRIASADHLGQAPPVAARATGRGYAPFRSKPRSQQGGSLVLLLRQVSWPKGGPVSSGVTWGYDGPPASPPAVVARALPGRDHRAARADPARHKRAPPEATHPAVDVACALGGQEPALVAQPCLRLCPLPERAWAYEAPGDSLPNQGRHDGVEGIWCPFGVATRHVEARRHGERDSSPAPFGGHAQVTQRHQAVRATCPSIVFLLADCQCPGQQRTQTTHPPLGRGHTQHSRPSGPTRSVSATRAPEGRAAACGASSRLRPRPETPATPPTGRSVGRR
jgi:hypothetical protein